MPISAICVTYILKTNLYSGVSRISFRRGVQIFLEKWGYLHGKAKQAPCSAWQSHAHASGVGGMLARENF